MIRTEQFLSASKIFSRSTGKAKVVFFPGCSLSGYNPDYIFKVQNYLEEKFGECGIITACCSKPLKLIGDVKTFHRRIESVKQELDTMNAEIVITACQNCYNILKKYDTERNVLSLWNIIQQKGLPKELKNKFSGMKAGVQYSCSSNSEIISSISEILRYLGVKIINKQVKIKCCGGIQLLTTGDLNLGHEFMIKRASEFHCKNIISYCASCRSAMCIDGKHRSIHILDLIFGNVETSNKKNSRLLNRYIITKKLKEI